MFYLRTRVFTNHEIVLKKYPVPLNIHLNRCVKYFIYVQLKKYLWMRQHNLKKLKQNMTIMKNKCYFITFNRALLLPSIRNSLSC